MSNVIDIVPERFLVSPDDFGGLWTPESVSVEDLDHNKRRLNGIVTPSELALVGLFGSSIHDRYDDNLSELTFDEHLERQRRAAVEGFRNERSSHEFGYVAALSLWHERNVGFAITDEEGYGRFSAAYDGWRRHHVVLTPQSIAGEVFGDVDRYAELFVRGFRNTQEVQDELDADYGRRLLEQSEADMIAEWQSHQPNRDPEVVKNEVIDARAHYTAVIARDDARRVRSGAE